MTEVYAQTSYLTDSSADSSSHLRSPLNRNFIYSVANKVSTHLE
jgi:hypothetical protein